MTTTEAKTESATVVVVWRRRRAKGARWEKMATVATWAEALALAGGNADYRFTEATDPNPKGESK